MKKNYILLIYFILSNTILKAQVTYYYNPELQEQVTANHSMRIGYNELVKKKYQEIQEKYEKVNEKVAQILVIKEQIHSYLTNVHSLIANGRQLKRTYADLTELFKKLERLSELTTSKPQYAVFCTPVYEKVYLQALESQQYITSIVLKEDEKYLLDMHNRIQFLSKVQQDIRYLNLLVYSIVLYIENAEKIPYWRHVPQLNLWYNHDKAMIDFIIQQAGYL